MHCLNTAQTGGVFVFILYNTAQEFTMAHKIIINLKIELSLNTSPICSICGQPIEPKQRMSLDHYIPKCHGGTDTADNLFPAHTICNSIKNDLMPDEFEQQKQELYQTALDNWHLKRKDKIILENALKHMR